MPGETPSLEKKKLYHGGRLYHGMDGGDYHGSKRDSLCDMTAEETPSRRHGRLYFYHGSKGDSLAVAQGTNQQQGLMPRWTWRLSCHRDNSLSSWHDKYRITRAAVVGSPASIRHTESLATPWYALPLPLSKQPLSCRRDIVSPSPCRTESSAMTNDR